MAAEAGTSEAAVRSWVERTRGSSGIDVIRVPHLSTQHYDFFVVSPRELGPAGEVFAMSDGDQVLPAGRDNLAAVLRREGFPENPDAIPAARLAELYVRMAEVRPVRILEDASDFAVRGLESFAPPRVETRDGGAELTFWTAGPDPKRVERWRVRVDAEGGLSHESEQLT